MNLINIYKDIFNFSIRSLRMCEDIFCVFICYVFDIHFMDIRILLLPCFYLSINFSFNLFLVLFPFLLLPLNEFILKIILSFVLLPQSKVKAWK